VQQADKRGNARIKGLTFADVEQAKAARKLIITCEELVAENFLKQEPDHNQIPFIHVDAVVPLPWGAYPTACYQHYDYDPEYLQSYRKVASDDKLYQNYLTEKIVNTKDHSEFVNLTGSEHLKKLIADPKTGYASGLDRS
jgi:glutaconate CoA-transferase subunit A